MRETVGINGGRNKEKRKSRKTLGAEPGGGDSGAERQSGMTEQ